MIYCRVSSLEQVEGTSLESQERMCRDYAKREGMAVSEVFIDRGESAKTADRTEFLNAISYCSKKKNDVSHFVVYKLDRFARNQEDHIGVRAKLKQYGVQLRSVTEPIDDSPMGKMMEGILSTFAEFDNNVRTERSTNGMKERLKKGIWVWSAPLGYKRLEKGGNLVPDEANAHYVRMVFDEYSKGVHTYKTLATLLFEKGFRSKGGKKIPFQTYEKMLKNPLYCGIIKVDTWGVEMRGDFEPIISEDLFRKCQESGRTHKSFSKLTKNPDFPLRKIVVCEWCGAPLTGSYSTGRHGKKYGYYHHHKQGCPCASSIRKDDLEKDFVSLLEEINPTVQYANLFKEAFMEIYNEENKKSEETSAAAQKELEKLKDKKAHIYNNFEDGVYTKTEFLERKREVDKLIIAGESVIATEDTSDVDIEKALDYCLSFVTDTPNKWSELAKYPEERLRFQNFIFDGNIPYTQNNGFGTAVLSPIYSIYQHWQADNSSLVIPRGIEPRFPG